MARPPEIPPVTPAPLGIPVQSASGQDQVPESWLTEPEHLDMARRLDVLVQDHALITDLALTGFVGDQYEYFAGELARYGIAVIGGWIRRRLIHARCRARGYGLPEPPAGAFDDPDVVDELTNETVAKALVHFRTDVLLRRRWDPRRGASLRTFFIGQCLIRFQNIYRTWLINETQTADVLVDDPTPSAGEPPCRTQPSHPTHPTRPVRRITVTRVSRCWRGRRRRSPG